MNKIIEVKGLKKSFKKHNVLKGVDFHIYEGKIFALLGSNGAGKTTCVRILSTLLKTDGGSAKICGFDVFTQADEVRSSISLTGQYAAVDEILTAKENLHLIGKLKKLKDTKKQTDELLKRFMLTEDADRRVSTFSGGMRRRLDISMSLMGNPKVIFLDEPTTGLDPQNRIAMWDLIAELAKNGTTILLTTQYLEEAEYLADHIAILHDGVITAEGSPNELKKILPIGEFVLEFSTEEERENAVKALAGLSMKIARKSIEISSDGSVSQLADILNTLDSAKIHVARFTQNQPSLEDAFIKIIGGNKND